MSRKMQRPAGMLPLVAVASGAVIVLVGLFGPVALPLLGPVWLPRLHILLELAGVLISFSVFIVNWESTKQSQNSQSLLISTGFLVVSSLQAIHLFSSSGMTPSSTGVDRANYYWLLARLWAPGVLLVAAFVRPTGTIWPGNRYRMLAANALVGMVLFAGVALFWDHLPPLFGLNGQLTPAGTVSGYLLVGLNLAAAGAFMRSFRARADEADLYIIASLIVSLFGGLASSLISDYQLYGLVAQAYSAAAYYILFRGLLVSAVRRPYTQLRMAKDRLEQAVGELDARNRELDALDEVALTLSSSLKIDAVLDAAIEKVMKVMQASGGAIYLTREGATEMKLAAWRGLTPDLVRSSMSGSPPLSQAVLDLSGELGKTTLDDAALVRSLGGMAARIAPLRACVCAPVASKGRVLGTIAMVAGEDRSFSPRDADLLTAIGYQLGLAVDNSWLYERTDERLREKLEALEKAERVSRFLSEVGAILGSSVELGPTLDLLARKTTQIVGDWCRVYVLDEREKVLRLEASYHEDEEELRNVRQILERSPVKIGQGPIGRVAETGLPVLTAQVSSEDAADETRWLAHSIQEIALLRHSTPSSSIIAPMRARGRTVGVMAVMITHAREPFDEGDLALVTALADRTGGAVESSRLFEESQAQRRHLEAVISQMIDGVVIVDQEARVVIANAAARQMMGPELDRLMNFTPSREDGDGSGDARARMSESPLLRRALAGEVVIGEELTVGEAARERVLSVSASAVRDDGDEVTGAVAVLRDVTAERELDQMKEEFMANVSHELRTPITAVLGYSDILLRGLRGPLAPKQMEALAAVRSAGQRLLLLINDLLDISKLESGKQEFMPVRLNLSAVVARTVSAIGVLANSKSIQLHSTVPENLPWVLADEEQLQRILGNLLSNAIKFTPEGGTVTVSAEPLPEEAHDTVLWRRTPPTRAVAVRVSDTGIGIPPEHQEKIWDKFFQVDSSSRRVFGGTGLGLAIAKSVVELHGGTIWVESEGVPGKGSTFVFTLPIASTDATD